MSKQLCRGLAVACGLSLLLAGCARHGNREQTNSHSSRQPAQVKPSPANLSVDSSPFIAAAPQSADAGSVAPEWPSPFPAALVSEPAVAQKPAGSRKSKSNANALTKSFIMPTATDANPMGRIVASTPPPPAIQPSAPDASQFAPFLNTMCCSATATYEPVKPNGFRRAIQRVPGLRRLDPSSTGSPGFVPPQPLHDIRFALPPDVSPTLMRKKRMDLKAIVDASGRVTRVELLSPRDEDLVTLAADAANAWHFAPAQLNGRPVPGEVLLHFSFDNSPMAQAAMDTSKGR